MLTDLHFLHYRQLFPKLQGKWGNIKLNEIADDLVELLGQYPAVNPWLDVAYCDSVLKFIHKVKEVDYTWGGYAEDRSLLWKGSYLPADQAFHRGVDFLVPVGTEVTIPATADLVYSKIDTDQEIGWGGKLIFQWLHGYVIFGHLKNIVTNTKKIYQPGDVIGVVAESAVNGGTSPHLHLQCMMHLNVDADGYGPLENLDLDFPNPLKMPW